MNEYIVVPTDNNMEWSATDYIALLSFDLEQKLIHWQNSFSPLQLADPNFSHANYYERSLATIVPLGAFMEKYKEANKQWLRDWFIEPNDSQLIISTRMALYELADVETEENRWTLDEFCSPRFKVFPNNPYVSMVFMLENAPEEAWAEICLQDFHRTDTNKIYLRI